MVKIRLFRTGRKHWPSYRIVAIDSQRKRNGKALEAIGFYDPKTNPPTIKIKPERLEYWLKRGAQLTKAVRKLIKA